eukprot:scaffold132980_cov54-Phaeocystis_antarctica.AAC.1
MGPNPNPNPSSNPDPGPHSDSGPDPTRCARPPARVRAAKAQWEARHDSSLIDRLDSELSGHFQERECNMAAAEAAAEHLYTKGEGQWNPNPTPSPNPDPDSNPSSNTSPNPDPNPHPTQARASGAPTRRHS